MLTMAARWLLPALIALATVPGCTLMSRGPTHSGATEAGAQGHATPAGAAQPAPGPLPGEPAPAGGSPGAGAARQFHLGPAAAALVAQAHQQAGTGDPTQASATLERALRIEPDNPLLWVELGRIRLAENNAVQADAMGRKALTLASGDADAQASARDLIAEAMRARGHNPEAYGADQRAAGAAPR